MVQRREEEKVRRDNRKRISNSLHGVRIKNKRAKKSSLKVCQTLNVSKDFYSTLKHRNNK